MDKIGLTYSKVVLDTAEVKWRRRKSGKEREEEKLWERLEKGKGKEDEETGEVKNLKKKKG